MMGSYWYESQNAERKTISRKPICRIPSFNLGIDQYSKMNRIPSSFYRDAMKSTNHTSAGAKYPMRDRFRIYSCSAPTAENARLIAYAIKRHIIETKEQVKRTPNFVKRTHSKIVYLHNYNCRVAQVISIYPLEDDLEQLLIKYIELELSILKNPEYNTDIYRLTLEMRLLTLLSTIYSKYCFYTSGKCNPSVTWHQILELFDRVPYDVHKFFEDIRQKVVDKIDFGQDNELLRRDPILEKSQVTCYKEIDGSVEVELNRENDPLLKCCESFNILPEVVEKPRTPLQCAEEVISDDEVIDTGQLNDDVKRDRESMFLPSLAERLNSLKHSSMLKEDVKPEIIDLCDDTPQRTGYIRRPFLPRNSMIDLVDSSDDEDPKNTVVQKSSANSLKCDKNVVSVINLSEDSCRNENVINRLSRTETVESSEVLVIDSSKSGQNGCTFRTQDEAEILRQIRESGASEVIIEMVNNKLVISPKDNLNSTDVNMTTEKQSAASDIMQITQSSPKPVEFKHVNKDVLESTVIDLCIESPTRLEEPFGKDCSKDNTLNDVVPSSAEFSTHLEQPFDKDCNVLRDVVPSGTESPTHLEQPVDKDCSKDNVLRDVVPSSTESPTHLEQPVDKDCSKDNVLSDVVPSSAESPTHLEKPIDKDCSKDNVLSDVVPSSKSPINSQTKDSTSQCTLNSNFQDKSTSSSQKSDSSNPQTVVIYKSSFDSVSSWASCESFRSIYEREFENELRKSPEFISASNEATSCSRSSCSEGTAKKDPLEHSASSVEEFERSDVTAFASDTKETTGLTAENDSKSNKSNVLPIWSDSEDTGNSDLDENILLADDEGDSDEDSRLGYENNGRLPTSKNDSYKYKNNQQEPEAKEHSDSKKSDDFFTCRRSVRDSSFDTQQTTNDTILVVPDVEDQKYSNTTEFQSKQLKKNEQDSESTTLSLTTDKSASVDLDETTEEQISKNKCPFLDKLYEVSEEEKKEKNHKKEGERQETSVDKTNLEIKNVPEVVTLDNKSISHADFPVEDNTIKSSSDLENIGESTENNFFSEHSENTESQIEKELPQNSKDSSFSNQPLNESLENQTVSLRTNETVANEEQNVNLSVTTQEHHNENCTQEKYQETMEEHGLQSETIETDLKTTLEEKIIDEDTADSLECNRPENIEEHTVEKVEFSTETGALSQKLDLSDRIEDEHIENGYTNEKLLNTTLVGDELIIEQNTNENEKNVDETNENNLQFKRQDNIEEHLIEAEAYPEPEASSQQVNFSVRNQEEYTEGSTLEEHLVTTVNTALIGDEVIEEQNIDESIQNRLQFNKLDSVEENIVKQDEIPSEAEALTKKVNLTEDDYTENCIQEKHLETTKENDFHSDTTEKELNTALVNDELLKEQKINENDKSIDESNDNRLQYNTLEIIEGNLVKKDEIPIEAEALSEKVDLSEGTQEEYNENYTQEKHLQTSKQSDFHSDTSKELNTAVIGDELIKEQNIDEYEKSIDESNENRLQYNPLEGSEVNLAKNDEILSEPEALSEKDSLSVGTQDQYTERSTQEKHLETVKENDFHSDTTEKELNTALVSDELMKEQNISENHKSNENGLQCNTQENIEGNLVKKDEIPTEAEALLKIVTLSVGTQEEYNENCTQETHLETTMENDFLSDTIEKEQKDALISDGLITDENVESVDNYNDLETIEENPNDKDEITTEPETLSPKVILSDRIQEELIENHTQDGNTGITEQDKLEKDSTENVLNTALGDVELVKKQKVKENDNNMDESVENRSTDKPKEDHIEKEQEGEEALGTRDILKGVSHTIDEQISIKGTLTSETDGSEDSSDFRHDNETGNCQQLIETEYVIENNAVYLDEYSVDNIIEISTCEGTAQNDDIENENLEDIDTDASHKQDVLENDDPLADEHQDVVSLKGQSTETIPDFPEFSEGKLAKDSSHRAENEGTESSNMEERKVEETISEDYTQVDENISGNETMIKEDNILSPIEDIENMNSTEQIEQLENEDESKNVELKDECYEEECSIANKTELGNLDVDNSQSTVLKNNIEQQQNHTLEDSNMLEEQNPSLGEQNKTPTDDAEVIKNLEIHGTSLEESKSEENLSQDDRELPLEIDNKMLTANNEDFSCALNEAAIENHENTTLTLKVCSAHEKIPDKKYDSADQSKSISIDPDRNVIVEILESIIQALENFGSVPPEDLDSKEETSSSNSSELMNTNEVSKESGGASFIEEPSSFVEDNQDQNKASLQESDTLVVTDEINNSKESDTIVQQQVVDQSSEKVENEPAETLSNFRNLKQDEFLLYVPEPAKYTQEQLRILNSEETKAREDPLKFLDALKNKNTRKDEVLNLTSTKKPHSEKNDTAKNIVHDMEAVELLSSFISKVNDVEIAKSDLSQHCSGKIPESSELGRDRNGDALKVLNLTTNNNIGEKKVTINQNSSKLVGRANDSTMGEKEHQKSDDAKNSDCQDVSKMQLKPSDIPTPESFAAYLPKNGEKVESAAPILYNTYEESLQDLRQSLSKFGTDVIQKSTESEDLHFPTHDQESDSEELLIDLDVQSEVILSPQETHVDSNDLNLHISNNYQTFLGKRNNKKIKTPKSLKNSITLYKGDTDDLYANSIVYSNASENNFKSLVQEYLEENKKPQRRKPNILKRRTRNNSPNVEKRPYLQPKLTVISHEPKASRPKTKAEIKQMPIGDIFQSALSDSDDDLPLAQRVKPKTPTPKKRKTRYGTTDILIGKQKNNELHKEASKRTRGKSGDRVTDALETPIFLDVTTTEEVVVKHANSKSLNKGKELLKENQGKRIRRKSGELNEETEKALMPLKNRRKSGEYDNSNNHLVYPKPSSQSVEMIDEIIKNKDVRTYRSKLRPRSCSGSETALDNASSAVVDTVLQLADPVPAFSEAKTIDTLSNDHAKRSKSSDKSKCRKATTFIDVSELIDVVDKGPVLSGDISDNYTSKLRRKSTQDYTPDLFTTVESNALGTENYAKNGKKLRSGSPRSKSNIKSSKDGKDILPPAKASVGRGRGRKSIQTVNASNLEVKVSGRGRKPKKVKLDEQPAVGDILINPQAIPSFEDDIIYRKLENVSPLHKPVKKPNLKLDITQAIKEPTSPTKFNMRTPSEIKKNVQISPSSAPITAATTPKERYKREFKAQIENAKIDITPKDVDTGLIGVEQTTEMHLRSQENLPLDASNKTLEAADIKKVVPPKWRGKSLFARCENPVKTIVEKLSNRLQIDPTSMDVENDKKQKESALCSKTDIGSILVEKRNSQQSTVPIDKAQIFVENKDIHSVVHNHGIEVLNALQPCAIVDHSSSNVIPRNSELIPEKTYGSHFVNDSAMPINLTLKNTSNELELHGIHSEYNCLSKSIEISTEAQNEEVQPSQTEHLKDTSLTPVNDLQSPNFTIHSVSENLITNNSLEPIAQTKETSMQPLEILDESVDTPLKDSKLTETTSANQCLQVDETDVSISNFTIKIETNDLLPAQSDKDDSTTKNSDESYDKILNEEQNGEIQSQDQKKPYANNWSECSHPTAHSVQECLNADNIVEEIGNNSSDETPIIPVERHSLDVLHENVDIASKDFTLQDNLASSKFEDIRETISENPTSLVDYKLEQKDVLSSESMQKTGTEKEALLVQSEKNNQEVSDCGFSDNAPKIDKVKEQSDKNSPEINDCNLYDDVSKIDKIEEQSDKNSSEINDGNSNDNTSKTDMIEEQSEIIENVATADYEGQSENIHDVEKLIQKSSEQRNNDEQSETALYDQSQEISDLQNHKEHKSAPRDAVAKDNAHFIDSEMNQHYYSEENNSEVVSPESEQSLPSVGEQIVESIAETSPEFMAPQENAEKDVSSNDKTDEVTEPKGIIKEDVPSNEEEPGSSSDHLTDQRHNLDTNMDMAQIEPPDVEHDIIPDNHSSSSHNKNIVEPSTGSIDAESENRKNESILREITCEASSEHSLEEGNNENDVEVEDDGNCAWFIEEQIVETIITTDLVEQELEQQELNEETREKMNEETQEKMNEQVDPLNEGPVTSAHISTRMQKSTSQLKSEETVFPSYDHPNEGTEISTSEQILENEQEKSIEDTSIEENLANKTTDSNDFDLVSIAQEAAKQACENFEEQSSYFDDTKSLIKQDLHSSIGDNIEVTDILTADIEKEKIQDKLLHLLQGSPEVEIRVSSEERKEISKEKKSAKDKVTKEKDSNNSKKQGTKKDKIYNSSTAREKNDTDSFKSSLKEGSSKKDGSTRSSEHSKDSFNSSLRADSDSEVEIRSKYSSRSKRRENSSHSEYRRKEKEKSKPVAEHEKKKSLHDSYRARDDKYPNGERSSRKDTSSSSSSRKHRSESSSSMNSASSSSNISGKDRDSDRKNYKSSTRSSDREKYRNHDKYKYDKNRKDSDTKSGNRKDKKEERGKSEHDKEVKYEKHRKDKSNSKEISHRDNDKNKYYSKNERTDKRKYEKTNAKEHIKDVDYKNSEKRESTTRGSRGDSYKKECKTDKYNKDNRKKDGLKNTEQKIETKKDKGRNKRETNHSIVFDELVIKLDRESIYKTTPSKVKDPPRGKSSKKYSSKASDKKDKDENEQRGRKKKDNTIQEVSKKEVRLDEKIFEKHEKSNKTIVTKSEEIKNNDLDHAKKNKLIDRIAPIQKKIHSDERGNLQDEDNSEVCITSVNQRIENYFDHSINSDKISKKRKSEDDEDCIIETTPEKPKKKKITHNSTTQRSYEKQTLAADDRQFKHIAGEQKEILDKENECVQSSGILEKEDLVHVDNKPTMSHSTCEELVENHDSSEIKRNSNNSPKIGEHSSREVPVEADTQSNIEQELEDYAPEIPKESIAVFQPVHSHETLTEEIETNVVTEPSTENSEEIQEMESTEDIVLNSEVFRNEEGDSLTNAEKVSEDVSKEYITEHKDGIELHSNQQINVVNSPMEAISHSEVLTTDDKDISKDNKDIVSGHEDCLDMNSAQQIKVATFPMDVDNQQAEINVPQDLELPAGSDEQKETEYSIPQVVTDLFAQPVEDGNKSDVKPCEPRHKPCSSEELFEESICPENLPELKTKLEYSEEKLEPQLDQTEAVHVPDYEPDNAEISNTYDSSSSGHNMSGSTTESETEMRDNKLSVEQKEDSIIASIKKRKKSTDEVSSPHHVTADSSEVNTDFSMKPEKARKTSADTDIGSIKDVISKSEIVDCKYSAIMLEGVSTGEQNNACSSSELLNNQELDEKVPTSGNNSVAQNEESKKIIDVDDLNTESSSKQIQFTTPLLKSSSTADSHDDVAYFELSLVTEVTDSSNNLLAYTACPSGSSERTNILEKAYQRVPLKVVGGDLPNLHKSIESSFQSSMDGRQKQDESRKLQPEILGQNVLSEEVFNPKISNNHESSLKTMEIPLTVSNMLADGQVAIEQKPNIRDSIDFNRSADGIQDLYKQIPDYFRNPSPPVPTTRVATLEGRNPSPPAASPVDICHDLDSYNIDSQRPQILPDFVDNKDTVNNFLDERGLLRQSNITTPATSLSFVPNSIPTTLQNSMVNFQQIFENSFQDNTVPNINTQYGNSKRDVSKLVASSSDNFYSQPSINAQPSTNLPTHSVQPLPGYMQGLKENAFCEIKTEKESELTRSDERATVLPGDVEFLEEYPCTSPENVLPNYKNETIKASPPTSTISQHSENTRDNVDINTSESSFQKGDHTYTMDALINGQSPQKKESPKYTGEYGKPITEFDMDELLDLRLIDESSTPASGIFCSSSSMNSDVGWPFNVEPASSNEIPSWDEHTKVIVEPQPQTYSNCYPDFSCLTMSCDMTDLSQGSDSSVTSMDKGNMDLSEWFNLSNTPELPVKKLRLDEIMTEQPLKETDFSKEVPKEESPKKDENKIPKGVEKTVKTEEKKISPKAEEKKVPKVEKKKPELLVFPTRKHGRTRVSATRKNTPVPKIEKEKTVEGTPSSSQPFLDDPKKQGSPSNDLVIKNEQLPHLVPLSRVSTRSSSKKDTIDSYVTPQSQSLYNSKSKSLENLESSESNISTPSKPLTGPNKPGTVFTVESLLKTNVSQPRVVTRSIQMQNANVSDTKVVSSQGIIRPSPPKDILHPSGVSARTAGILPTDASTQKQVTLNKRDLKGKTLRLQVNPTFLKYLNVKKSPVEIANAPPLVALQPEHQSKSLLNKSMEASVKLQEPVKNAADAIAKKSSIVESNKKPPLTKPEVVKAPSKKPSNSPLQDNKLLCESRTMTRKVNELMNQSLKRSNEEERGNEEKKPRNSSTAADEFDNLVKSASNPMFKSHDQQLKDNPRRDTRAQYSRSSHSYNAQHVGHSVPRVPKETARHARSNDLRSHTEKRPSPYVERSRSRNNTAGSSKWVSPTFHRSEGDRKYTSSNYVQSNSRSRSDPGRNSDVKGTSPMQSLFPDPSSKSPDASGGDVDWRERIESKVDQEYLAFSSQTRLYSGSTTSK